VKTTDNLTMEGIMIRGTDYQYDESIVRHIPIGQSTLSTFERQVLALLDEGCSFDEAVDKILFKGGVL